ncbi:SRPBCC family protein [Novosphingobium sp. PP1Y]|uniref:aromatic ring-hydroxylating oxygenase subunit alpha n=1 Tax=Novosphingobium sp. PP1Y TaxID=702113 RepID=UPI00020EF9F1|nr:aromatic ring-hydroxylating dioxygenase subunit alpha [Novosphingobium sp. PP1Y]CCA90679.1 ring hydroxylating dioxygenase, alpha subunit [Novosphingobium sp. PP1Y]
MTIEDIRALVDDRPSNGWFSVNRAAFTDEALFEQEIRHVFEGGWVFLGMESQAPDKHSYFTVTIGRIPIVVMRDGEGKLDAFVNACPHKGALICHRRAGKGRLHVCRYHSWSFDSAGRNVAVKGMNAGAYSEEFISRDRNLSRLPAFANYRGFLFGSLVPTCPIEEHLGEARRLLDLSADQGEDGLELVPGEIVFTFDGNWKYQLENCSDAYHFTSAHPSYIRLLDKRAKERRPESVRSIWEKDKNWSEEAEGVTGGSYSFDEGHVLNWGLIAVSDAVPLFERAEILAERYGAARRDWMFNMRNLTIFPNLQLAENASSQLRIIRPLAANKTEMRTFCIAPRGESAEARRQRIRNYEDFFNPTGMATPDDTVSYEDCQAGNANPLQSWAYGYCRGATASVTGGNAFSDLLEMNPARSVLGDAMLCDETLYHSYYRAWLARMEAGAAQETHDA